MDDAWTPATTHVVIATPSGKRYWDDLATRVPHTRPDEKMVRRGVQNGAIGDPTAGGGRLGDYDAAAQSPSGAPLLDWWEIPEPEGELMTTRYLVGDVFDRLAEIPDGTVDLVVTSPPFLALRSYLPADHPDKGKEIGSEPTPAAFIDVMLAVTAELRRVLAPHGSIAVELGDTYAGSGGAGGDYADNGWRDGQEPFRQAKNTRSSHWSRIDAEWVAAMIDAEGAVYVSRDGRKDHYHYSPMVAIAMREGDRVADRLMHVTGVGTVTRQGDVVKWNATGQQARYVLANVWHLLMVKQDRAKAAIELGRHIEAGRGGRGKAAVTADDLAYRETIRQYITTRNDKGGNRGRYVVDWEPPTPPVLRHSLMTGSEWPEPKSRTMIPQLYEVALAYGINPLTGEPSPAGRWRVRNVVTWCRPNPPVGALGDKWRPATSDVVVACVSDKRYWDDLATRTPYADGIPPVRPQNPALAASPTKGNTMIEGKMMHSNPSGAPLLDYWVIPPKGYSGAHYAVYPQELVVPLVKAMCPQRVCLTCGEPSRRIVEMDRLGVDSHHIRHDNPSRGYEIGRIPSAPEHDPNRRTLGWTDCGHDNWRAGITLDPFAGSGTTLAVAQGHGRDSIGVDLDSRNAELAQGRLGLFLEVES